MVSFVQSIRARFPDALILPNNALELLDDYGDVLYGVTVEDLYTRCDPLRRVCAPTPLEETRFKESKLNAFKSRFKKPVFNILYDYSGDKSLIRHAVKRSKKLGYHWYLTNPELTELGTIGR